MHIFAYESKYELKQASLVGLRGTQVSGRWFNRSGLECRIHEMDDIINTCSQIPVKYCLTQQFALLLSWTYYSLYLS